MATEFRLVPARAVTSMIHDALMAGGLPADDAAKVAESDDRGRSHRRRRPRHLPPAAICPPAQGRRHQPAPEHHRHQAAPATALVDGDNGMGHLVMAAPPRRRSNSRARPASPGSARGGRTMPAPAGSMPRCRPSGHDRHLHRRRQRQPHGAVGRHRPLLGTNPLAIAIPTGERHRWCSTWRRRSSSYGTVKDYVLHGLRNAGRLDDQHQDRRAAHRSEAQRRGTAAADRRLQGQRAGAHARPARRRLNGAAFGKDVVDFNADETSVTETGHVLIALDVARFIRSTVHGARSSATCRICATRKRCPASTGSACPARSAASAAGSACATACRSRRR